MSAARRGGKRKRYGRNSRKCEAYRHSGKLERRKIRNLMRHCGLSRQQALKRWRSTRKRGREDISSDVS